MILRLSDLVGIGDRSIPALGLVDLAIREKTFCDSMTIFFESCREVSDEKFLETENLTEEIAIRSRILGVLQDWFLSGDIEDVLLNYFSNITHHLPEIGALPQSWLSDEAVRLIESSFSIERSCLPRKPLFSLSDHYRLLLRHKRGPLSAAASFLSPILYWLHHPFSPMSCGEEIPELIVQVAKHGRSASTESSIVARLLQKGMAVRMPFLRVLLANEPRLAVGNRHGSPVVWVIEELFPTFDFAAHHLNELSYLDVSLQFQLPTDEEQGYSEIRSVRTRRGAVQKFFENSDFSTRPTEFEVDWRDLAHKLACVRAENIELTVQNIGATLHAAIVKQLQRSGRAMRLDELQRALGTNFDLSPEMIGPAIGNGQIMAYARHPRFLAKDEAFYVLSDLVETDFVKKGRIPRSHIVTPFVEKHWEFSEEDLLDAIGRDSVFGLTKLILLHRIVTYLSRMLPSMPTEPFFVKKMMDRAKLMLSDRSVFLGRGAYALRGDLHLLFGDSELPDSDDAVRARFVGVGLGVSTGIRDAVLMIPTANDRDDLLRII